MNLDQIEQQGFILALFIRDDGTRFLLGSREFEFVEKQLHFAANTISNDLVEVQGADGMFLAGQVRRSTAQSFDGYIGDATVSQANIEAYRRSFLAFFRKDFYYKVVYILPSGAAIQRRTGFLVEAPEAREIYQYMPQYHVALNFEDVNYYTYAEDAEGEEVYGKSAIIKLSTLVTGGGLVWDNVGAVWDNVGAVWDAGGDDIPTTVTVDSIDRVLPIWRVTGKAVNPQLSVITTATTLSYAGTVLEGQTLEVDFANKTALLNGTSVIGDLSGDWPYFNPGLNRVAFTAQNNDAPNSTIMWQEIVG